jgi:hypothetical protein
MSALGGPSDTAWTTGLLACIDTMLKPAVRHGLLARL